MDEVILHLEPRDVTGKAVKRLRNEGQVPAVIHDHGKPSLHVTGNYIEVSKAYKAAGKHHTVQVVTGGKRYATLIKQVDVDPKKHGLRHVVFNAVNANEKVTAEVPVHIKFAEGNDSAPAERAGLVVLHQAESVEIEALLKDLPDILEFDGEALVEVGDHATVADLIVPTGVTVKTDPSHPLATVFEPSALQAANDAAGGDAEEATGEGAGEQTAEGEAAEPQAESSEPEAQKDE